MTAKRLLVIFSIISLSHSLPAYPSGGYLPSGGSQHLGISSYETSGSHISNQQFGGGYHQHVQDQKHVYFFASPDTREHSRLRIQIVPNSQRNTKIIFVKAPSYGALVPEVVAPPSISEDKTVVYVLVKKHQHDGQITIPAGVGIRPSKPEVYFIKYKSQHDAAEAVKEGTSGQPVGTNVPEVANEEKFVNTFERDYGVGVIQPR
ncbi:uncharacterized protein LOC116173561 [Photinus pyralis]|uniref:uncharacterized protein LOC116173561 n=1 Tax=Photinus pyralis TaxID=7054 RepID=UPI001267781F|nr:uncharacterized protein LOC116173561 [Photinus pyralis]